MKLLFEASEPVQASRGQVRALIDDGWALAAFLGQGRADGQAALRYVEVDHRDGVVGFQGQWWYRGELSASEVAGQTVVTYRVYTFASRGAWAVPLANRMFVGYHRRVQAGAAGLARAIERHLAQAA